jgi:two-component system chemotaxis sensor kinase CheA
VEAIDEVVAEFLVESHENLDRLDRDLLALERDPGSRELLAGVFRTIHTIKGTSGFLAFHRLEELTHVGENLLSKLRDGRIALTDARSNALLQMVDAIRGLLTDIEASGREGDDDHAELIATLSALARMEPALGDPRVIGSILVGHGDATPEAVEAALQAHAEARAAVYRSVIDGSVRVDVELLDSLVILVGELAEARDDIAAGLADAGEALRDRSLAGSVQRLDRVTAELQQQVLRTRMQPVDAVWSKMPRVVRNLARTCGRQVRLELEGHETELDRSVLEALKDPLTHLVRNAVDHGIESPQARVGAGKPAEGVLTLRACRDGGQVRLEVADDGAGIDPEKIASTALQCGLVSRARLATMCPREILDLIFLPGFSTAPTVTRVSGRGVGMDVVRTRVEAVGGSVDVSSTVGKGSSFRLTIPMTGAILPALAPGSSWPRRLRKNPLGGAA